MRLLRIEAFVGNDSRHGQVVGVADPADGVGVLAVAVGELRRAPAVDRLADELLGADEEAEADEDDDRVLPAQPVHVVVVDAELDLADAQHRLEQLLHRPSVNAPSIQPARLDELRDDAASDACKTETRRFSRRPGGLDEVKTASVLLSLIHI